MKTIFRFGLLLVSLQSLALPSHAQKTIEDWNLCARTSCNAQQRKVQEGFNGNPRFFMNSSTPMIFSGSCWHRAPGVDPDHEHYGLFVFYPSVDGPMRTRGVYSYHNPVNPFTGMNLSAVEKMLETAAPRFYPIKLAADYALLSFDFPKSEHHTWFRRGEDGRQVYLVNFAQYEDSWEMSWCQLAAHE